MAQPWWEYNRIDNFGTIDPQGNYWKPDSNIQLEGNYPIVAILPGIVTSVQYTSFGQTVVTIKLDSPLNSLATHTFYEHMSSATVRTGQHVSVGDLIGYNNPSGQVPLGFGLYSGDVYGSGSAWQILQHDLAPGGAQLLNPVSLLDSAKSGQGVPSSGSGSTSTLGGILAAIPHLKEIVGASSLVLFGGAGLLLLLLGGVIFFVYKETHK